MSRLTGGVGRVTSLREDTVTAETPSRDDRLWEAEDAVVFRGDGDPRTPETILRWLAELDGPSIEADSYSMGGAVEKLEIRFAEMLGKESAVFMPELYILSCQVNSSSFE